MGKWRCRPGDDGHGNYHAAISSTGGVVTTTCDWANFGWNQVRYTEESLWGAWKHVPGSLYHVSISKDYIIGTNIKDEIYWLDLKK